MFFENLKVNEYNATTLQIVDRLTGTPRHIRVSSFYPNACTFIDNTGLIRTFPNVAAIVEFEAYDLGALDYNVVAKVQSHATDPYFSILKAGSILPAVDDTYAIGGVGAMWNAGRIKLMTGGVNTKDYTLGLPLNRNATTNFCRYDAPTDTFEIYDGAVWQPH